MPPLRRTTIFALGWALTALLSGCVSSTKVFHNNEHKKYDYSVIYLVRPKEDPAEVMGTIAERFRALGYNVMEFDSNQAPEGGEGTGFIVSGSGYLLTCDHILGDAAAARVWIGDKRYEAEVAARDKEKDIALLKLKGQPPPGLVPLSFRAAETMLGEQIVALGYPISNMLGTGVHVTQGLISATTGVQGNQHQMQISAAIQPGNSGGPVLDANGMVTGIVQQTINPWAVAQQTGGVLPQNVNFGLRASVALAFLKEKVPALHAQLSFDQPSRVDAAQNAVVRIRGGVLSEELEKANKVAVFVDYESFLDIWYRFRYFVLSFYDFESHALLFRAGQVRDNLLSNRTVVIDDTFRKVEDVMGRAAKR